VHIINTKDAKYLLTLTDIKLAMNIIICYFSSLYFLEQQSRSNCRNQIIKYLWQLQSSDTEGTTQSRLISEDVQQIDHSNVTGHVPNL